MPSTRAIKAGAAYVELFTENSRFVRGLRLAESRLRAFGQKASQIGKRMLLFSGAIATPLAFASRTFAGFEDQMKSVQAVTGAVGDQFDRLYNQAKRFGRTTSFTAAQVAGGMLSLGRAGFNPAEIEAATAGVLNLARATGTDLAAAADIAAGTLRAFSLEADQMGRVTDVLVATANNSAQTMEDLGESMKYAAPIAEEYGLEPPVVAAEAMDAILSYRWPGNVRQLRAMCERWVITRAGQRLEREHLSRDITGDQDVGASSGALHVNDNVPLKENLARVCQQVERAYLYKALKRHRGHLGNTAKWAGITRRTLYTKMKQYGLVAADFR